MSALPEQYQRYARPAAVTPAEVELSTERTPIAWVADPHNPSVSVAIDARLIQRPEPAAPRDLAPQPLFDPTAQRLLCGGVGGGVLLWGGGQLFAGLSQVVSALSGMGALLFFLALAGARAVFGGGRRAGASIEVHNHARWFGKTHTTL